MGKTTEIAWCDHTFNPWIGCTKVSAGCANCYAAAQDHRWGHDSWGRGKPRRITGESYWRQPVQWAKEAAQDGVRRRVFCASLADVFDAEAPVEARRRLWELIRATYDDLDWLLVTKRPERILGVMVEDSLNLDFFKLCRCWLLTTVESQIQTKRIPDLLSVDAAVHGVSIEPMLEAVDVSRYLGVRHEDEYGENGINIVNPNQRYADEVNLLGGLPMHDPWVSGLNWVICGGESGGGARPMRSEWARSLRDQCQAESVAFFFKQWGDWLPGGQDGASGDRQCLNCSDSPQRVGKKSAGRLLDGREWSEYPEVSRG